MASASCLVHVTNVGVFPMLNISNFLLRINLRRKDDYVVVFAAYHPAIIITFLKDPTTDF